MMLHNVLQKLSGGGQVMLSGPDSQMRHNRCGVTILRKSPRQESGKG